MHGTVLKGENLQNRCRLCVWPLKLLHTEKVKNLKGSQMPASIQSESLLTQTAQYKNKVRHTHTMKHNYLTNKTYCNGNRVTATQKKHSREQNTKWLNAALRKKQHHTHTIPQPIPNWHHALSVSRKLTTQEPCVANFLHNPTPEEGNIFKKYHHQEVA